MTGGADAAKEVLRRLKNNKLDRDYASSSAGVWSRPRWKKGPTVKDGDSEAVIQLEGVCLQELLHMVQDDVRLALWQQPQPGCCAQLDFGGRLCMHAAPITQPSSTHPYFS